MAAGRSARQQFQHFPISYFLNRLQLDEDELKQLREYVKEKRQQYREQAGMYNRASENLATRSKTAVAGAPKVLSKREKRKLRAFGGGQKKPTTPSHSRPGTRPGTAAPTRGGMVTSQSKRFVEENFDLEPQEPASLITQPAFRTMENQVRLIAAKPCALPQFSALSTFTEKPIRLHISAARPIHCWRNSRS
jgi:hypothetical protein